MLSRSPGNSGRHAYHMVTAYYDNNTVVFPLDWLWTQSHIRHWQLPPRVVLVSETIFPDRLLSATCSFPEQEYHWLNEHRRPSTCEGDPVLYDRRLLLPWTHGSPCNYMGRLAPGRHACHSHIDSGMVLCRILDIQVFLNIISNCSSPLQGWTRACTTDIKWEMVP
jgi:hypothetical protein